MCIKDVGVVGLAGGSY